MTTMLIHIREERSRLHSFLQTLAGAYASSGGVVSPPALSSPTTWGAGPSAGLVWRDISAGHESTVVQCQVDPGYTTGRIMHPAPYDKTLVVVSGFALVDIEGQLHEVFAGESLLIPRNKYHEASYPEGAEMLLIFRPSIWHNTRPALP